MIFNMIIVFISIILENIFNLYITRFNYFIPLFTLVSLIFIFPSFEHKKNNYYITSAIIGFIYDLFFTNFYILNSILFLLVSIGIYYILSTHKNSYFLIFETTLFVIFFYNILLFLILNFFNYVNYNLFDFSYFLRFFIVGNIIYSSILYLLFYKKFNNHKFSYSAYNYVGE